MEPKLRRTERNILKRNAREVWPKCVGGERQSATCRLTCQCEMTRTASSLNAYRRTASSLNAYRRIFPLHVNILGVVDQVRHLAEHILPALCIAEYFEKSNFLDANCFKILLSKALGYGIVVGSSIVKVPQILKLYGSKSGAGISLFSLYLELFAITTTLAYSLNYKFPFSAWGESLFLLLETAIIVVMVLMYRGKNLHAITYLVTQISIVALLLSGLVPEKVLKIMQASQMVVVLMSKLIQIVENKKNNSTGQLSALTVGLLFAGSVARIFTSVQETGDALVVLTYIVSSLANGILCAQIIYYWNTPAKGKKVYKKDKKQ
ncbi:Mannose-P-dolichol utilization defect 1 protein-like protein [Hypsibius exemplaris]|uniref:Mannose-P-dolichol utilization defect 1 protein homolog n=1 Tax=Hypsibius exemplaris TaxID=2072580 RepID=A0A1W0WJC7_HYPEX|nr:Mannose-P-dolichol utilization defect 1 protein-like protein [Hypsibius exemplaris]